MATTLPFSPSSTVSSLVYREGDFDTDNAGSGIRDQGSGIRDQGSGIRDQAGSDLVFSVSFEIPSIFVLFLGPLGVLGGS
jgi:hypothetical protein